MQSLPALNAQRWNWHFTVAFNGGRTKVLNASAGGRKDMISIECTETERKTSTGMMMAHFWLMLVVLIGRDGVVEMEILSWLLVWTRNGLLMRFHTSGRSIETFVMASFLPPSTHHHPHKGYITSSSTALPLLRAIIIYIIIIVITGILLRASCDDIEWILSGWRVWEDDSQKVSEVH